MQVRLKNAAAAKNYREKLLQEQNGIDPILGIQITQPVLDHQHFAPFQCRAVLQSEVNAFEGKIFNAYRRYIKHLSDKPLPEVLKGLIAYLERDFSKSPIHHTGICDEVRPFRRASAETQNAVLITLGIEPAANAKKRIKQIRNALLEGKIDYQTLKVSLSANQTSPADNLLSLPSPPAAPNPAG